MGCGFSCLPPPKSPGAIAALRKHARTARAKSLGRAMCRNEIFVRDGMALGFRIAGPHSRIAAPLGVQPIDLCKFFRRFALSSCTL